MAAAPPSAATLDGPLPPEFLPTDEQGNPLCTSVRAQPVGDPRCTAFAVAAAMEAAYCWEAQSAAGVPFLSIDDLYAGTPHLYRTAEQAELGVVDERCWPPKKPKCADARAFRWVLSWSDLATVDITEMPRAMRRWLVTHGPIAISVRMFDDFDRFSDSQNEGRVYAPRPGARALNDAHALCVLGYRTAPAPTWIVKNSRDVRWGFKGFGQIFAADAKLKPELIVVAVHHVEAPR